MSQRRARIVVAEGTSPRKGLLRFVLEGEGYDVVAEASTTAELAARLGEHHPDVVVMDDGIGVMAVGMVHEVAPASKVILVWPEAVVPIGGDARVEPSAVLRRLGPTVEQLTGVPSTTGNLEGRQGLTAATGGALGLGAILALGRAAGGPGAGSPADMPSGSAIERGEPIIDDREAAPVLILPSEPAAETAAEAEGDAAAVEMAGPLTLAELEQASASEEPAAAVATAAVAGTAVAGVEAASAGTAPAAAAVTAAGLNRRLGTIALGGAAVAASLVLALALSGSRVATLSVEGPTPSSTNGAVSSPSIPPPQTVVVPGTVLGDVGGGGGTHPITLVVATVPGSGPSGGAAPGGGGGGGAGGGGAPQGGGGGGTGANTGGGGGGHGDVGGSGGGTPSGSTGGGSGDSSGEHGGDDDGRDQVGHGGHGDHGEHGGHGGGHGDHEGEGHHGDHGDGHGGDGDGHGGEGDHGEGHGDHGGDGDHGEGH